MRTFTDSPAVRAKTPLLLGLIGPSGTGKTFSALRLATGIQRVSGGDIFFIDTEANRGLHYADKFKFRHVPFGAPFGSLDYLQVIEYCYAKKPGIIIVDSMSHEHEGPGGMLETYERAMEGKPMSYSMLAWKKPKTERRRLINSLLQMNTNFIFCFRAKEKLKIVKGKDHEQMGFMPIAGEEFVYEMTAKFLLLPGANGHPSWQSEQSGEKVMMKLPEQFISLFAERVQLDEPLGQRMAEWANGPSTNQAKDWAKELQSATTVDALGIVWKSMNKAEQKQHLATKDARKAELSAPAPSQDILALIDELTALPGGKAILEAAYREDNISADDMVAESSRYGPILETLIRQTQEANS